MDPDTDAWTLGKASPDAEACVLELTEEKVLLPRELLGYYTGMARLTGTLWEHMNGHASCNHSFAAYAANLLYYSIKKEEPPVKLNL